MDIPADFPMLDGWPRTTGRDGGDWDAQGPSREPSSRWRSPAATDVRGQPPYRDQLHLVVERRRTTGGGSSPPTPTRSRRRRGAWTTRATSTALAPARPAGVAGNISHYEVRPTKVGGQSFGLVHYYTYDGAPAIGLRSTTWSGWAARCWSSRRTTRAVVADYPPTASSRRPGRRGGGGIAAAMCQFTEAGC